MRFLCLLFALALSLGEGVGTLLGAEFHLTNGDIVRGQAVSFDDDGMIVRLDIGGYSSRIGWSKLTQESLQELSKTPEAARFVEPFIDTPPVVKEKEKKKDIVIKPVPRVERIAKPSFVSSIATPVGIAVFLVLFLANLYAAYEIALFRHRPPALVCGLSAIFPVLAPILFLSMPPAPEAEEAAAGAVEPSAAAAATGKSTTGSLAKVPMASGLSVAREEKPAAAASQGPQTFKRGEFTFNRRFFETKFPGFFRVVPAEPDQVLVVRTAKTEHVAKRISRISSNEVHVQLAKGGNEVSVPFPEITEIHVRHKDGKA